jgi:hypothetical protein
LQNQSAVIWKLAVLFGNRQPFKPLESPFFIIGTRTEARSQIGTNLAVASKYPRLLLVTWQNADKDSVFAGSPCFLNRYDSLPAGAASSLHHSFLPVYSRLGTSLSSYKHPTAASSKML